MAIGLTAGVPIRSGTAPAESTTAPTRVELNVPYISQRPYADLCWAAVFAMLISRTGIATTMCQVASNVLSIRCCSATYVGACDRGEDPRLPYQRNGSNIDTYIGQYDPAHIIQEVGERGRPLQLFYDLGGGIGHTVLIVGYEEENGWLKIHDPWLGSGWWRYPVVQQACGLGGIWSHTFYNLGVPNGPNPSVA
jgi:hypothetical protein